MPVDTQYAYAVARIRAVEKSLLDKTEIERIIETKTADEAFKLILDSGYGESSSDQYILYNYEKLLKDEYRKAFDLLREISPQPDVFNLFLQRNDFHNLKVILKSEFIGTENYDDMLIDSATIPVSKLKVMVRERKMSEMSEIMSKAIEECIDTFNRTGDPQTIDLILDRASFAQMAEMAELHENSFVLNIVRILTDLANIKIFLRVRAQKKSWDFLQKVLLPGGTIDHGVFVKILQDSLENAVNKLKYTQYGKFIEESITEYQKSGNLTKFEKFSDDFVVEYAQKAHYINLGIEPLIGYLIAKEMEIKNVRIVMVGKMNEISSDIIRERLRKSYV